MSIGRPNSTTTRAARLRRWLLKELKLMVLAASVVAISACGLVLAFPALSYETALRIILAAYIVHMAVRTIEGIARQ